MRIEQTKLDGVMLIEADIMEDHRGFLMESYNKEKLQQSGVTYDFVQDNHTLSKEIGTLRGLHYQLHPKAQTKVVRVISGAIYDVVVDIRKGSRTFGDWIGIVLDEDNKQQILIPKGFAHGFCTLARQTVVVYKLDEYYSPLHERGIIWNDPDLAIPWACANPILSEKDQTLPRLQFAELN